MTKRIFPRKAVQAIAWIAANDETSELTDLQAVAHQISVCLVADIFGIHEVDVAEAVLAIRNGKPAPRGPAKACRLCHRPTFASSRVCDRH